MRQHGTFAGDVIGSTSTSTVTPARRSDVPGGTMDRHPSSPVVTRSGAQESDERDLRTAIVDALAAASRDKQTLRNGVWTYVRGERELGVAPGVVILALTDMVDRAKITPEAARDARTRDVILWCVEAYFGQRGGVPAGSG